MNKLDREMFLELKQEIAELTKLVREISFVLDLKYETSKKEPKPFEYNLPKKRGSPYEPIFLKEREYFNP
tara:strand:+ start:5212 stop:5421 length:210 start_codon:yes stop_codon:yes gene_type:complete